MNLCLNCATLIDEEAYACHSCGRAHDSVRYARLVRTASRYAELGVVYRSRYEAQLRRHGKIIEKYDLTPPEWLIFISIAALSGIIGNAAYDVVKAIINKIVNNSAKSNIVYLSDYQKGDFKLESEEDIKRLIGYLKDYHHGLSNVHPDVWRAIEEEESIHHSLTGLQDLIMKTYGGGEQSSSEDSTKIMDNARRKRSELNQSLSESDFEGLWNEIDNDDEERDLS
jgi:uncharacterized membrane protein YvbJ